MLFTWFFSYHVLFTKVKKKKKSQTAAVRTTEKAIGGINGLFKRLNMTKDDKKMRIFIKFTLAVLFLG